MGGKCANGIFCCRYGEDDSAELSRQEICGLAYMGPLEGFAFACMKERMAFGDREVDVT